MEQNLKSKSVLKKNRKIAYRYALENFLSNENSIIINDELSIKRFTDEEKKTFYDRVSDSWINEVREDLYKNDFFLEYYTEEKSSEFFGDNVGLRVLEMFRILFRVFQKGKIEIRFYNQYILDEQLKEYKSAGFVMVPSTYKSSHSNYVLNSEHVTQFVDFSNKYLQFKLKNNNILNISTKRFNFSYSRNDWEDQVIDLMIGFECLFLRDNAELNYKLSLRTAIFLSELGTKEVFDFIKDAYGMRSKIVHGSVVKKEKREVIAYTERLRELLRQALFKYINDYSNKSDKEFIDDIESKILKIGTAL
jgi:hypothetical protein